MAHCFSLWVAFLYDYELVLVRTHSVRNRIRVIGVSPELFMSDLLLATLGTAADIDQLLEHNAWDPMVLSAKGHDIGRIEVIDVATCQATHGFSVKRWIELDAGLQLFRPVVGEIDCYFDPIQFKQTLAQDLSMRVFGDPTRSAMHLCIEPHIHALHYWSEVDQDEKAYTHAVTNCSQNSKDLRDLPHFNQAISTIQNFTRIHCSA